MECKDAESQTLPSETLSEEEELLTSRAARQPWRANLLRASSLCTVVCVAFAMVTLCRFAQSSLLLHGSKDNLVDLYVHVQASENKDFQQTESEAHHAAHVKEVETDFHPAVCAGHAIP